MTTIVKTKLEQNGDFRSPESVEILKEADIVITNPPFSLFREYVAQLVEYDKKFVVVGNQNAVAYKEIFKLIKANKIWLGATMDGRNKWFQVPNSYPTGSNVANSKIENGKKYLFVKGCLWFTNLNRQKQNEDLILYRTYNPKDYPQYDNYDAINVNVTKDIPADYAGAMGVPITFLNKYNSEQFEIVGLLTDKREKHESLIQGTQIYLDEQHKKYVGPVVNGRATYNRILIKNKRLQ
jgi:hypothetical protein